MNEDPKLAAAIIAGVISLVGTCLTAGVSAVVSVLVARWQARWQVQVKLDELTQTQFRDVLTKRIEAYPRLWHIMQTFTSDWRRAGKAVDCDWAQTFFDRLTAWHAEYGVFLSQSAYERFTDLRS